MKYDDEALMKQVQASFRDKLTQERREVRNLRMVGFDPDTPPPDNVRAAAADLFGPGNRQARRRLLRREAVKALFPEQCVGEQATDSLIVRMESRVSAMVSYVAKNWEESLRLDQLTPHQREAARERAQAARRDEWVRQSAVLDLRMVGFDMDVPPSDGVRAKALDLLGSCQPEARRSVLMREAARAIFPEQCVGEDATDRLLARMSGRVSAMVDYVADSWDDCLPTQATIS